jgi:hypothetical protein
MSEQHESEITAPQETELAELPEEKTGLKQSWTVLLTGIQGASQHQFLFKKRINVKEITVYCRDKKTSEGVTFIRKDINGKKAKG